MTRKSQKTNNSPSLAERLEMFKAICNDAGLKVTHQRLEIFHILAQSTDHPSAEEVFEKVKHNVPTIALDTVYRTLTTLAQHGVLKKVLVDTRARFDPNLTVHHHFVCTECKRIDDFYWPAFDSMKPPENGPAWGRIDARHVEIRGICQACLKAMKQQA